MAEAYPDYIKQTVGAGEQVIVDVTNLPGAFDAGVIVAVTPGASAQAKVEFALNLTGTELWHSTKIEGAVIGSTDKVITIQSPIGAIRLISTSGATVFELRGRSIRVRL